MRVISIFPFGIAVFFIQVSTSAPNQVRFHHSSSTSSIYVFFPALSLVFFIFILVKKFHHRLQCIVAQFPIEFIWFYHFRENRMHSSREWISLFFSPHPRSHFFCSLFLRLWTNEPFYRGFYLHGWYFYANGIVALSAEPCWKIACEMSLEWKVDRPWLCQNAFRQIATVCTLYTVIGLGLGYRGKTYNSNYIEMTGIK